MQLVKAPRDKLLRPLQTVSGIVERRHTLPILANVLMRQERRPTCRSPPPTSRSRSDQRAEFGAGRQAVATTVAARKLLDILRALPDGEVTAHAQSTSV